MTYKKPCNFKMGEEIRVLGTVDFFIVKGIEAKTASNKYQYHLLYCENDEGVKKTFKEWEVITNEPNSD